MRVVAGRLGGRTLVAPKGMTTRPTTDRVRESLFSILGVLEGARVADLWAGTGALGIEALSRGAASAVLVESAAPALAALRENVRALGLGEVATVVAKPVERAGEALAGAGPFDLVLADPPWADVTSGRSGRALAALLARGVLAPTGRLVLEHSSADPAPELAGAALVDARRYGDTALAFYEVAANPAGTLRGAPPPDVD